MYAKVEVSSPKKSQFLTAKLRLFCFSAAVFATQISSHDLIATLAWELHFSFQRHLTLILIKSSSIYMGNVGNPLENTNIHNELVLEFSFVKWNGQNKTCSVIFMLHRYGNYICFIFKVHIFWEGHKILRNLHLTFGCMYCSQK